MTKKYESSTTIYTGIVSGFSIDQVGSSPKNYFTIENALDNLKTIIKSQTTLEEVCLRLFAQSMMYGDLEKDNFHITSESFRHLWSIVPVDVKALIDKNSIDNTVMRLRAYKTDDPNNFIYGLIHYSLDNFSVRFLSEVETVRRGNSDMLELKYVSNDPALAYQTILLMSDIFMKKYRELQFSETNDVVGYFRAELIRQRGVLRELEDSLMVFKRDNKIIEYEQQTREIASMDAELTKSFNESELSQKGAGSALGLLDNKMRDRTTAVSQNSKLMDAINKEAMLVEMINRRESSMSDEAARKDSLLVRYRAELVGIRQSLNSATTNIGNYETSADGILSADILSAFLLENITAVKSDTQMGILAFKRSEMDTLYKAYSVIGATLKRMEREIKVAEHSYLNILDNLNSALQRQKNLQLSSASLQVITPAVFPVNHMPSKRKQLVFGSAVGALIFVVTLLLFLDLVPTTLRNPDKAERLTGRKVLTAFPFMNPEQEDEPLCQMSMHYLAKVVSLRVESGKMLVVNLLSVERGQGKTFIAEKLEAIFEKRGYSVKYMAYGRDFDEDSRTYDHAASVKDLLTNVTRNHDLIIVEHPAMIESNIPRRLLQDHSLNLLVCRPTLAWTQACSATMKRVDSKKDLDIELLLNGVNGEIMEEYVGLIPPVSMFRRFRYNLVNLDLRSLVLDMFSVSGKRSNAKSDSDIL